MSKYRYIPASATDEVRERIAEVAKRQRRSMAATAGIALEIGLRDLEREVEMEGLDNPQGMEAWAYKKTVTEG